MSEIISKAAELAKKIEGPEWLNSFRTLGLTQWQQAKWPTRKTEHWKYSSLRAFNENDFFATQVHRQGGDEQKLSSELFDIPGLNASRLVFVDGIYSEELSSDRYPLNVDIVFFSKAEGAHKEIISEYLGSAIDLEKNIFARFNTADLNEGVLIQIKQDQKVDQTVQIVHVSTKGESEFTAQQRVLVIAERHSESTIVEHFVSTEEIQNSFTNTATELILKDGSSLNHYRLNMEQENIVHVGNVSANLRANATLNSFVLGFGGKLKRIDFKVNHLGSGAHCEMAGVYLPKNKQHIDYHTCIDHQVPHCTSNEVFRGIMADESKAVFNGRIHIYPDAQKTYAEMSNKNLLLSHKAEINTKPELEIYADDVRCAHGATVSQIEEKALYYMQSRGISKKEAEVMLSFGFINELISGIKHGPIQNLLRPVLARQFSRDEELLKHII